MEKTFVPEAQLSLLDAVMRVSYVQRWGNASSIVLLDPTCLLFSKSGIEGIIGYRKEAGCAIAFGDPVSPPECMMSLAAAFHDHCRQQGLRIVYVTASEEFAQQLCAVGEWALIEFGKEIILNPQRDVKEESGEHARLLRKKYNQAVKEGITVSEYAGSDVVVEAEFEAVKEAWLAGRHGPQLYLSSINLFADRCNKRWFYAQQQGKVIGVLMLNRLDAFQGWVHNVLMLRPEAKASASELLTITVLETLREEGCHYYTIGPCPGDIGSIHGLGRISSFMVRMAFSVAKRCFNLTGRQKYWEKFQPRLKPSYLIFSEGGLWLHEIIGIIKAFNVGR